MNAALHACLLNGISIVALLILYKNARPIVPRKNTHQKLFYGIIITLIAQAFLYAASYVLEWVHYFSNYPLAVLSCSSLFAVNAVLEFEWLLYVLAKTEGEHFRFSGWRLLSLIPVTAIVVGSIINLFTPFYYTLSAETWIYVRNQVPYSLNVLSAVLYFSSSVAVSYKRRCGKKDYVFFPIVAFHVPVLIGMLGELLIPAANVLPLSGALAVISLFMSIQTQNTLVESLSGLYSRHHLINVLSSEDWRSHKGRRLMGIIMDLDKFKAINDTYGHLMGDDAIRTMGRLIRESLDRQSYGFRYAGDEFVIIQMAEHEADAEGLVRLLRERTEAFNKTGEKPYRLYFSAGYTEYKENDTVDTFFARMDAAMYEEKKKEDERSAREKMQ